MSLKDGLISRLTRLMYVPYLGKRRPWNHKLGHKGTSCGNKWSGSAVASGR